MNEKVTKMSKEKEKKSAASNGLRCGRTKVETRPGRTRCKVCATTMENVLQSHSLCAKGKHVVQLIFPVVPPQCPNSGLSAVVSTWGASHHISSSTQPRVLFVEHWSGTEALADFTYHQQQPDLPRSFISNSTQSH